MPKEELDQMLDLLSGKRDLDVDFDENPWKEPPEAVVRKGMQAVREYFDDLFVEGVTVHRNMIKVVLVGQEGAGKTRWALFTGVMVGCRVCLHMETYRPFSRRKRFPHAPAPGVRRSPLNPSPPP